MVFLGFIAASGFVVANRDPAPAAAETVEESDTPFFATRNDVRKLRDSLATVRAEMDLMRSQYERAHRIIDFSTQYNITASLAGQIFDAAVQHGLDPELAFRLVRLESEFNPRAVSPVGAVGLTQLMPSTAVQYQKGVTREKLFDRETNLRIGFTYLRKLVKMFDGNVSLALLAYNRGEEAVFRDLKAGKDPAQGWGYVKWVAKGYTGKGVID
jgi:soluble lytic murein transglycosylase-like protein